MNQFKSYKDFVPGRITTINLLLRRTLLRLFFYSAVITIAAILFISCKEKKQAVTVINKDVYYTCSMHPQVMEDHPGNCPICGMKLIAVPKSSTNASTQVRLSTEQIKLGNIQIDTIRNGSIGDKITFTGTLNFNQDKLSSVSARVEGRIERLYFKNIGDYIHKGDKLYDLYSEQLNNAKQEYINALQQESSIGNSIINYHALVESAKNKLLLWGMTNEQINHLEAQVYTTQMSSLNKSENVSVQIPDLNNLTIKGKIDFVNPEINPDTRISIVRVTIPNINNQLHPGMPVYIIASNSAHNSITLPVDAVLTDSKGSTVWVQTKPGIYEVRMIQTGINDGNAVEITSGLHTGDVVVTVGAYLINSEYIFEHGANPMAGMDMSNMKM